MEKINHPYGLMVKKPHKSGKFGDGGAVFAPT